MKYCSLMFVYAIKSIDSVNIKFYVKMQLSYCGQSNRHPYCGVCNAPLRWRSEITPFFRDFKKGHFKMMYQPTNSKNPPHRRDVFIKQAIT